MTAKRETRALGSSAILLLALATGACDSVQAVNRDAKLDAPPALACVQQAIRETPGVAEVRRARARTGRELTLTGLHSPGMAEYFIYRGAEGSHVRGVVQLEPEWHGRTHFSHHLARVNETIPPEDVAASRPVMRRIEQALAARCGLSQVAAVREECLGVSCPPLGER